MNEKINKIVLSQEELERIRVKAVSRLPLNPSAQGWQGAQIRQVFADVVTGNEDSVLSELENKLIIIKEIIEEISREPNLDVDCEILFSIERPIDAKVGKVLFRIVQDDIEPTEPIEPIEPIGEGNE